MSRASFYSKIGWIEQRCYMQDRATQRLIKHRAIQQPGEDHQVPYYILFGPGGLKTAYPGKKKLFRCTIYAVVGMSQISSSNWISIYNLWREEI